MGHGRPTDVAAVAGMFIVGVSAFSMGIGASIALIVTGSPIAMGVSVFSFGVAGLAGYRLGKA